MAGRLLRSGRRRAGGAAGATAVGASTATAAGASLLGAGGAGGGWARRWRPGPSTVVAAATRGGPTREGRPRPRARRGWPGAGGAACARGVGGGVAGG
jgi:hypothetical protein